jgi:hypothetical protein
VAHYLMRVFEDSERHRWEQAEPVEIVTKLILRDGRGRLAILADSLVFLI